MQATYSAGNTSECVSEGYIESGKLRVGDPCFDSDPNVIILPARIGRLTILQKLTSREEEGEKSKNVQANLASPPLGH